MMMLLIGLILIGLGLVVWGLSGLKGSSDTRPVLSSSVDEDLPRGIVVESGGGLQCCCPNCDYGKGTQDTFIDGHAKVIERTCTACGTRYQSLTVGQIPVSGRHGL
jgi:hypothetical protein